MISKILNIVDRVTEWVEKRPQRLRKQALDAAEIYIELNESSSVDGKVVSADKRERLMRHYLKQFYAWRDGR